MEKRENIIRRLMELEENFPAENHYYFTGKSILLLEAYGVRLIEKETKMVFKGIVKHFSIVVPYFDDLKGADKFLCELRESVSIARNCYDEYSGIILMEFDIEWSIHGVNESLIKVLEYIGAFNQIRFIVLLPDTEKKRLNFTQLFRL